MTTTSQACVRFEAQLADYLEGTLPPAEQAEARRHTMACPRCGPLAADLAAIAEAAASLPPLRPERDLWAGIAARIEPEIVPLADRLPTGRSAPQTPQTPRAARVTHVSMPRHWLAAAAGILVAVSIGGTWTAVRYFGDAAPVVASRPTSDTARTTASLPPAPQVAEAGPVQRPPSGPETRLAPPAASQVASDGPRPKIPTRPPERMAPAGGARLTTSVTGGAEIAFDAEIGALRRIVDERRDQLDSATVAVIERNISLIDSAIAESKRALARDPNSRFLGNQLTRAYDTKVQLLRTAALLPAKL